MIVLANSDGGFSNLGHEEYSLAFGTAFNQQTMEKLLAKRDAIEQSLLDNANRPTPAELAQYGTEIADALLSGDVGPLYMVLGVDRVEITIAADTPDSKKVPWEYILWPDVKQAPHPARSIARVVAVANAAPHTPSKRKASKIKVLLIGADIIDGVAIPWDETKAILERIFGLRTSAIVGRAEVEFTMVEGVTKQGFFDAVEAQAFDVIHFIGHGQADGLFLKGSEGKGTDFLPKDALSSQMAVVRPSLLLLSACNTAAPANGQAYDNLAEGLVNSGVPAVVAHQLPINVRAIAEFSGALYKSLLTTGNIDAAVNAGRIELVKQLSGGNSASVEWGIPVLYRRPGCSQLFNMQGT